MINFIYIIILILIVCIFFAHELKIFKLISLRIHKEEKKLASTDELFGLAVEWIMIKQYGYSISEFLKKEGYRNIAIYGMGKLGERLYDELFDSGIDVAYAIDINQNQIHTNLPVYSMNSDLSQVDVVVVTVIMDSDRICRELDEKGFNTKCINNLLSDVIIQGQYYEK